MEKAPAGRRGMLSGSAQEGYAAGNVLAGSQLLLPLWAAAMAASFLGSLPALLLVWLICFKVKESEVWERSKSQSWGEHIREVFLHWKLSSILLAFMTMMSLAFDGTQDMYPTFLQRQWHYSPMRRSAITRILRRRGHHWRHRGWASFGSVGA